ncbi:MAG TPA: lytic transglycosylase domain-containing protein [Sphingomonas sp.]
MKTGSKTALLIGLALGALSANAARAADILPAPDTLRTVATTITAGAGAVLSPIERDRYRAIFEAIRGQRWSDAQAGIAAAGDGALTPVARAELLLAAGSPRASREDLLALLAQAPELPQAPQLALLAKKRGATDLPPLPAPHDLYWQDGQPRRASTPSTAGDLAAASLAAQARPLLKTDQPAAAEALLAAASDKLGAEARTEWQQRIAWSYFLNNDDASATRLAALAIKGVGEWTVQAQWVAGLSAWRQRDCKAAAAAFTAVGSYAGDDEMRAAGLFWTARADLACNRFDKVQARLRAAARAPETFYGLISARLLGIATPKAAIVTRLTAPEWTMLATLPDSRRAAALAEIGEYGLADEMLRWQARIGAGATASPNLHRALLHLAAQLDLPATQIWLAHNCPSGETIEISARYPAPNWMPQGGWQVDKALVFAHTLQESRFRTDAVSPAGARGLMQVMPGTADLIEKRRGGVPVDRATLASPAVNMGYGQAYLQSLRDATGGLLPKVIAAYNAGPNAVARWDINNRAQNDPLLYIESIPYAETRGYVTMVLRNYWIYQQQSGEHTSSLAALAQGQWPRFPTMAAAARAGLASAAGAVMALRPGTLSN